METNYKKLSEDLFKKGIEVSERLKEASMTAEVLFEQNKQYEEMLRNCVEALDKSIETMKMDDEYIKELEKENEHLKQQIGIGIEIMEENEGIIETLEEEIEELKNEIEILKAN